MTKPQPTPSDPQRRELLAGALAMLAAGPGIAAAASTGSTGSASAPGREVGAVGNVSGSAGPEPTFDAQQLFRKLHYRTDDGLLFWWLKGPKIGQVGATLTPLYTNAVGTIQRVTQRADGGFDLTMLEMTFKLELGTGRPLREWRNPYTGEVLPVTFAPVGPLTIRYRPDGSRELPTDLGGARLEATATTHAPIVVGDDLFFRDESVARVHTPGRPRPFEVNDIALYHGSLADLTDPRVTSGDATVFFAEVTDWQRWMNMGDRPGGLTSRLAGRKVASYADLPADWRALLAAEAPEIAADPVAALDRPAARFDR